jgi:TatD DNase family protein
MNQLFLDSHAHLDDAQFDADRDAVMDRARAAGLKYLLCISGASGPDDLASAIPLAEQHDLIYASVGIHPHEAQRTTPQHFEMLAEAAKHPKVIALGEIGLDYYYDHSSRQAQQEVFVRQMEMARHLKLPIVIHCRDAFEDLTKLVRAHWTASGWRGVLHCFSGSLDDARRFIEWGFLVSFAGTLTFKKADGQRAIARELPLESLLVETDCHYLAPVPHRGQRNEPAFVLETARVLARERGISEAELGMQLVRNFEQLFRIDSRSEHGAHPPFHRG